MTRNVIMYGQPPLYGPSYSQPDKVPQTTPTTITTTQIVIPGPGVEDAELVAIRAVMGAVRDLDEDGQWRVLRYVAERLNATLERPGKGTT